MDKRPLTGFVLTLLLGTVCGMPTIRLLSPSFDATFMTIPPSTTAKIPIQFQILEESSLSSQLLRVCLTLRSSETAVFENECIESTKNNLNLNFVPVGPGTLELSLMLDGQMVPSSLVQSPFRVVSMESALPLLIGPSALQFLANPQTDSSDASIEFFLSDLTLKDYLLVCLEVCDV
jgi:hypothetical protein